MTKIKFLYTKWLTSGVEYDIIAIEINRMVIFRINYNIPVMFESGGDKNYPSYSDRSEINSKYGEKIAVRYFFRCGYPFL